MIGNFNELREGMRVFYYPVTDDKERAKAIGVTLDESKNVPGGAEE